jgi:hypothetical protein
MRKAFLLLLAVLVCPMLEAKEEQRKCNMGRDYWLYTPDNIVTGKIYWLVVGVHGAKGNGKGAGGLAGWVTEMDNVIVIGPSFPIAGPYFQGLGGESDRQLLDIHKDLKKKYKLHDKMFLHGFSAGSQYSHRFTNKHPKAVIGVSAHSGGSWDPSPDNKAKSVLWTISCGLNDKALSTPDSKYNRIDAFRAFYAAMEKEKGFTCKPFVTDKGHSPGGELRENAKECFMAATTGMFNYQREATKGMTVAQREIWLLKDTKLEVKTFDDGQKKYDLKCNIDGWMVGKDALKAMAETRKMLDRLSATAK